jgi:hypothetical protein
MYLGKLKTGSGVGWRGRDREGEGEECVEKIDPAMKGLLTPF